MLKRWHCLTPSDKWGIFHKLMAILWASAFLSFTPESLVPVVDRQLTTLLIGAIIVGAIAGIIGRFRYWHLTVELPGLFLIQAGLLFYAGVQGILAIGDPVNRVALTILAIWIASTFWERLEFLIRKWVSVIREEAK